MNVWSLTMKLCMTFASERSNLSLPHVSFINPFVFLKDQESLPRISVFFEGSFQRESFRRISAFLKDRFEGSEIRVNDWNSIRFSDYSFCKSIRTIGNDPFEGFLSFPRIISKYWNSIRFSNYSFSELNFV